MAATCQQAGEYAKGMDLALFKTRDDDNTGYVELNEYRSMAALYEHADESDRFEFF